MKWSLTLENHCLTTERCVSGGERQRLWPGESAGCRLPENWVTPTALERIPSTCDPGKGSLASRIPGKVMRQASCHMILFLSHFNDSKIMKTFTHNNHNKYLWSLYSVIGIDSIICFNLHRKPGMLVYYYYPYFMDEKTEAGSV